VAENQNRKIKKKRNRGFTLVEVLVAAAILSIMVTPILSSFVAIARVNAKSRRKLSATAIANSVMESVKGFELSDVSKQFNNPSGGFHIIAGTISGASEIGGASYSGSTFTARASGVYEFSITGVQMDGTTYDVRLKYTKNVTKTNELLTGLTYVNSSGATVTYTTTKVLSEMGVRVLTFYDVEVKVYKGGTTTNPLATLTGSKADYTPEVP
jgi:prepilin-type N-terminal cleavage/methylation domain-containing protein